MARRGGVDCFFVVFFSGAGKTTPGAGRKKKRSQGKAQPLRTACWAQTHRRPQSTCPPFSSAVTFWSAMQRLTREGARLPSGGRRGDEGRAGETERSGKQQHLFVLHVSLAEASYRVWHGRMRYCQGFLTWTWSQPFTGLHFSFRLLVTTSLFWALGPSIALATSCHRQKNWKGNKIFRLLSIVSGCLLHVFPFNMNFTYNTVTEFILYIF